LCELERIERERRAAQRRLKAARFPTVRTLEAFDFAAAPTLNKPLVLELARCDFVERRENLLLVGGPGTGQTHLATALGVEACGRGKRVWFYRVTELVTQLMEAREERQLGQIRSRLSKLDLLILEGLGIGHSRSCRQDFGTAFQYRSNGKMHVSPCFHHSLTSATVAFLPSSLRLRMTISMPIKSQSNALESNPRPSGSRSQRLRSSAERDLSRR
jgi:hypothetical protein